MVYNLLNIGTEYTMESQKEDIATAAVFLLGEGKIAAKAENGFFIPLTKLTGTTGVEWFQKKFNKNLKEFIILNNIEIADTLTTIIMGNEEYRQKFFERLDNASPVERELIINDIYKRDFMNQKIMSIGFSLAEQLIELK